MYELLTEVVHQAIENRLAQVNTNLPATIVSYDAARNRAVVKVTMPKAMTDTDYPLEGPKIVEVPVVWPASGGGVASFTMPLKSGDGVMLAVQQRSIENWLSGNNSAPDDPRWFDISDSVAIAGCSHNGTVAHSEDVVLKFNKTEVRILPNNIIKLGNDQGSITIDASGNIVLHGQSVRVETSARSFNLETHVHENTQPRLGSVSGIPQSS